MSPHFNVSGFEARHQRGRMLQRRNKPATAEFLDYWEGQRDNFYLSSLRRLHLVLSFHWFDEIATGRKRIEYRAMTPRWKKLIWDRRFELGAVRFSRGYTSTMTTHRILRITRGPCPIPGWDGDFYQIHFL